MELNGSVNRSIISTVYSNDSSILPTEKAHVQLNSDLSKANGIEKVSDDDVYVDDFESDVDGDANGEQ